MPECQTSMLPEFLWYQDWRQLSCALSASARTLFQPSRDAQGLGIEADMPHLETAALMLAEIKLGLPCARPDQCIQFINTVIWVPVRTAPR